MAVASRVAAARVRAEEVLVAAPQPRRQPLRRARAWHWRVATLVALLAGCLSLHGLTVWEGQRLARSRKEQAALIVRLQALRAAVEERCSALTAGSPAEMPAPVPLTVQVPSARLPLQGRR